MHPQSPTRPRIVWCHIMTDSIFRHTTSLKGAIPIFQNRELFVFILVNSTRFIIDFVTLLYLISRFISIFVSFRTNLRNIAIDRLHIQPVKKANPNLHNIRLARNNPHSLRYHKSIPSYTLPSIFWECYI